MYAFKSAELAVAKEASTHRSRRPWLAAVAALGLAGSTLSCSLLVDSSTDQCSANTDCPGGAQCLDGVCIGGGCQTNAECAAQLGDEFSICRKSDKKCVPLKSAQCQTIEGDYKSDDAFIFGTINPTTGVDEGVGIPIERSVMLAVGEINDRATGLPPASGSAARRPVVMIGCDDTGDDAISVTAAKHLVDEVGVPAIIGHAFSGTTMLLAGDVTIPANVLLFSSSATSDDITSYADRPLGAGPEAAGLIWRTSPPDVFQAAALSSYVNTIVAPAVEADIAALMLTDKVRVAILHRGDSYGRNLGEALEKALVINGVQLDAADAATYKRVDYGDDTAPMYDVAIDGALALKAHIIIVLGFSEGIDPIFSNIENNWDATTMNARPKPRFIFPDGGFVADLAAAVDAQPNPDEVRKRISGSVPGTTNPRFNNFISAYNVRFGNLDEPKVFGAAGAYDAAYLLAYSVASLQGGPPLGPALAEGLRKMSAGTPIDVGPTKAGTAFMDLTNGMTIDFDGASGPLNFDPATGEAPSDIQIWCVGSDGTNATLETSGLSYSAATSMLDGAIDMVKCGLP